MKWKPVWEKLGKKISLVLCQYCIKSLNIAPVTRLGRTLASSPEHTGELWLHTRSPLTSHKPLWNHVCVCVCVGGSIDWTVNDVRLCDTGMHGEFLHAGGGGGLRPKQTSLLADMCFVLSQGSQLCSVVRQRQRPRGLISLKCLLQYVCRHRI